MRSNLSKYKNKKRKKSGTTLASIICIQFKIKMVFILSLILAVKNFKQNIKPKLINISKKRLTTVITKMLRLGEIYHKEWTLISSLKSMKIALKYWEQATYLIINLIYHFKYLYKKDGILMVLSELRAPKK